MSSCLTVTIFIGKASNLQAAKSSDSSEKMRGKIPSLDLAACQTLSNGRQKPMAVKPNMHEMPNMCDMPFVTDIQHTDGFCSHAWRVVSTCRRYTRKNR
jgi:hypothetical protein